MARYKNIGVLTNHCATLSLFGWWYRRYRSFIDRLIDWLIDWLIDLWIDRLIDWCYLLFFFHLKQGLLVFHSLTSVKKLPLKKNPRKTGASFQKFGLLSDNIREALCICWFNAGRRLRPWPSIKPASTTHLPNVWPMLAHRRALAQHCSNIG